MKTKFITTKAVVVCLVSLALVLISFNAGIGGLEPPGPPGSPESSMPSLGEIYEAASGPPPKPLAFDCFLKIEGIDGESVDDKHKDWIEVLSYSHGVSMPSATHGGGGGAIGQCEHQDFSVVKTLDKASPKLALYCCEGKHIQKVELDLCRTTDKQTYMKYTLYDAIVNEVNPKGDPQTGDDRPMEDVSFVYREIYWLYTEYDPNGNKEGNVEAHWDIAANKGL